MVGGGGVEEASCQVGLGSKTLPLTCCVISGKSFPLSELQ